MRIYGVVENINKNNRNGFYTPTIKVYYADYIRRYGENKDNPKSANEVKKEREKIAKENEYRDSLNTDYTGVTKKKGNMNTLTLNKYIKYCDSMNYQNIVNTSEDLTGRHVKLHIQITDHKIFTSDDSKNNRLGEWTKPKKVQDDVWYCKLLYERTGEYVYPKSNIDTVYFLKTENIDASSLSEGDNLVVYGQIVNYDVEDGEFELLVRYYEKE